MTKSSFIIPSLQTYHNTAHQKEIRIAAGNLDNLYDIEEAAEKVWDQLTTRNDWKFEYLEHKQPKKSNGKERLAMIFKQLGLDSDL
jgi:hypothetical protein